MNFALKLFRERRNGGRERRKSCGELFFVFGGDGGGESALHHARFADSLCVFADCRKNLLVNHVDHYVCFDFYRLDVVLEHYLVSRAHLCLGVDVVYFEQFYVLLGEIHRESFGSGAQVEQSAYIGGFFNPFVIVAVSVEDYSLVLLDGIADEMVQLFLEVGGGFENVGKLSEGFGDCCVEDGVAVCYGA